MSPLWEERIGSLTSAGGVIWAVREGTLNLASVQALSFANLKVGPLETAAFGILIWLHAKWRRSIRIK